MASIVVEVKRDSSAFLFGISLFDGIYLLTVCCHICRRCEMSTRRLVIDVVRYDMREYITSVWWKMPDEGHTAGVGFLQFKEASSSTGCRDAKPHVSRMFTFWMGVGGGVCV